MGESGSDNYTTDNGADYKWNPTNTEWEWFTVTLNKNDGTLSWQKANFTILEAGADGYISIGTPEDLNKLAVMYRNNVNNVSYKAKLSADIDYTAYKLGSFASLGSSQTFPFRGEFNGQGHTITIDIVNSGSSRTGLFAYVNAATIKNLIVEGSATSAGNNCVGGLGGRSDGDGTLIENVVVKTDVSYTGSNGDATCGGFFANMEAQVTLKNCAFYGSINTGTAEGNGGLVGWAGSGTNNKYINCLVAPTTYTQNGNSGDLARNNPSVTNCHKVANSDARLASGEMTYILNGNSSEDVEWYQTIGTDAYPVPFGTAVVYAVGELYCDGTSKDGDLTFSNTNESNRDPHHYNEWGFCDNVNGNSAKCNDMNLSFMTPVDGYYMIGTKEQLNWLAVYVNEHDRTANAKLTADIDFSTQGVMIGGTDDDSHRYKGHFDGQGHTVTVGYNRSEKFAALFSILGSGAIVENLRTAGTITTSNQHAAGIAGGARGNAIIRNCVSAVAITATGSGDGTHAGICGFMFDTGSITNCAFVGSLTTKNCEGNAGLLGYANGGDAIHLTNCYVYADFDFKDSNSNSWAMKRNTNSLTNCYYIKKTEGGNFQIVNDLNQLAGNYTDATLVGTGELAFLLNGKVSGGSDWYQTLADETDVYPVPFSAHGLVYANGTFYCDGAPKSIVYENENKGETHDSHNYGDWGLCTNQHDDIVCDDANPEYVTLSDGFYPLTDKKELNWFAMFVNQGKGNNANAKLEADIDMTDVNAFPGIGTADHNYAGTIDGQRHKISHLAMNRDQQGVGLVARATDGVVIRNLLIDNTCSFTGREGVAAFIGGTYGSEGTFLLENCGNEAEVNATSKNAGAFIGCNYANDKSLAKIYNSYNTGNINSTTEGGAFSGWLHKAFEIYNCYNTGALTGCEGFARGYEEKIANSYSTSNSATGTYGRAANYEINNISDGGVFAALFAYNSNGVDGSVWRMDYSASTPHPVLYGNQIAMRDDCANRIVDGSFDVRIYRTLSTDNWNTFVVPFAISNDELKVAFGDDVQVAEFSETANGENSTISFKTMATPAVAANKPVLLKTSTAGSIYDFASRAIANDEAKVEGTNFDFVGAYEKTFVATGDYYLSNNKIYKSTSDDGSFINGLRAYIKAKSSEARIVSFLIDEDGETTAINGADMKKSMSNADIYNLNGQKVIQPVKGLYIQNGRKVVKR